MKIQLLELGWSAPRNDYTTYSVRVLVGAVKTGEVHLAHSRCVHVNTKEYRQAGVEAEVNARIGAEIIKHLLERA